MFTPKTVRFGTDGGSHGRVGAGASANALTLAVCSLVSACVAPTLVERSPALPLLPPSIASDAGASCLANAPVDLSIDVRDPPPSFYVNELRLGYARGEAIFLSRPLCEMYGMPLCRFVEAHERAHHYMKTVGAHSTCAETLADCWAAVHSDGEAVEAALGYFRALQGGEGYHAEPRERAVTIARCASSSRSAGAGIVLSDAKPTP